MTAADASLPSRKNQWAVFAVVAIGVLMATLDSSIVNISLPAIARSFHRPLNGVLQWVVMAYLLVIVSLLLTAGRLGDMLGRKPIWQLGLVLFTLGSALAGLAPSIGALIASRAVQGVGAALLMAISPALLTGAFPPSERGRALGMNSLTVALGVSLGPPLGGIITERLSWRWIFFINLPLGVLGIVLAALLLPAPTGRQPLRFDLAGAALLAVSLASLTGAMSFGHELGWGSPPIVLGLILAALGLLLLGWQEARHPAPILDPRLLRNPRFSLAWVSLVASFLALFGVAFLTPFYLQQLRGLSTERAGLLMMAYPLALALFAPVAGLLSDKLGSGVLAPLGLFVAAGALVQLGLCDEHTPLLDVGARLSLAGIGQALFQPANSSALMGAAPRDRQGLAGGLLATGRVLGQGLGVAVAGAVFAAFGGAEAGRLLALRHQVRAEPWLVETFVSSYRAALWVGAAIALVGALVSLARGKLR
jgi:EmrB/QacA subfamily drug resistance transporter